MGLVTGLCLGGLGHDVIGVDRDPERVRIISYYYEIMGARTVLGFQPKGSFEDELNKTTSWYPQVVPEDATMRGTRPLSCLAVLL